MSDSSPAIYEYSEPGSVLDVAKLFHRECVAMDMTGAATRAAFSPHICLHFGAISRLCCATVAFSSHYMCVYHCLQIMTMMLY